VLYFEISLRVIHDVTNDGGSAFFTIVFIFTQKIKIILSVCAALITINDNSCYFIIYFVPAKWKSKVFYNAGMLHCCAEWQCVLCTLIVYFSVYTTYLLVRILNFLFPVYAAKLFYRTVCSFCRLHSCTIF